MYKLPKELKDIIQQLLIKATHPQASFEVINQCLVELNKLESAEEVKKEE